MSDDTGLSSGGLGGALGARIARLAADVTVSTRSRMTGVQTDVGRRIFADVTNHVSDEIRQVMGPLWREMGESLDDTNPVRDLVRSLGNKRGQAWAWIAGTATGTALGAGLLAMITNAVNPATRAIIAATPNMQLAPNEAAAADVRGLAHGINGRVEAAYSGIDATRYEILRSMATRFPTVDETWSLLNRGLISRDHAIGLLRRNGVSLNDLEPLLALRHMTPSPADLAAMQQRDIITMDQGAALARHNGVSAEDFTRLTELAGDPLPPQDALTALRRGIITSDRARRAITQGPIRKEWFDVLEELQYAPMSTADAADAVNQGHLTLPQGQEIAKWNGLRADHFATLIESAGQPPGIDFATEAYNRGLITDEEFRVMFLESRVKNRYLDLLRAMRTRIIPQETVRLLYREGVYSLEDARRTLQQHGFTSADADALLQLEVTRRHEETKELTRTEIVTLYETRTIGRADAEAWLGEIGYDSEGVGWELAIADLRRVRKFTEAAIGRIRALYVAHRLDETQARTALVQLQVATAEQDDLMALWTIERGANTRDLTTAQIQTAVRRQLISSEEGEDRLRRMGYAPEDAALLMGLTAPAGG